ncbi:hypothetical protein [Bradyrhizobium sp. LB11.1]|uniref:PaaI family thioesterase n=1 Tax=Bradyrhizobium sp. LB11.1 TaxID=3156326 RepID=UPI003392871E
MSLEQLIAANASARLNTMAGFEVRAASDGVAEIVMKWHDGLTQYAGHLHAGMIAALVDCVWICCRQPGRQRHGNAFLDELSEAGSRPPFIAKGSTIRAGRKQIFAKAELLAADEEGRRLLVAAVMDGTWRPEGQWRGLGPGGFVKMTTNNPELPASVVAEMKAAEAAIIAGTLKPFTGPIKDQAGNQKVAAGGAMADGDVKGMTWLIEGVQGTLPKT